MIFEKKLQILSLLLTEEESRFFYCSGVAGITSRIEEFGILEDKEK
jgi:hypothetical protein